MRSAERTESKKDDDPLRLSPVLVGENGVMRFYTDSWTDIYTRRVNEYDATGMSLPGRMYVLLCVPKDGDRSSYIAFDQTGKPYLEFTDSWDLNFKMRLLALNQMDRNNIINMAKKRKEE